MDRKFLLALGSFAIAGQPIALKTRPIRVQIERVGQDDTLECLVSSGSATAMERFLDENRRDVVGKQHNLVCVKLLSVLPLQILVADQARLQQPGREYTCPRKGI